MKLEDLREFEHIYNPQHLYCRLIDLGLEKEYAKRIAHIYDIGIYQGLMEEINDKRRSMQQSRTRRT